MQQLQRQLQVQLQRWHQEQPLQLQQQQQQQQQQQLSSQWPAASGQQPAHIFQYMCGPWERGVFFQSLRRCAHCKQDSRCALTRVASELGAKFQCRSRPPCRRIGLSYRCAGRFLASGGGLRPGRPDQVELTPTRCLPPPDLDRSHCE